MDINKEAVKVAKTLSRYAITHEYSTYQAAEDGFIAGAKYELENISYKLMTEILPNYLHGGDIDEIIAKLEEE